MKKIFFLAVAATAMLAACNKTEVVPTGDAQEISFVAVNKTATKTPVDGVTFRDGDNMAVAAYIVEGTTPNDFFGYTLFAKETGATNWTGQPARYWPLTTAKINFLAVTEVGGGVDNTTVTFEANDYASGATAVLAGNHANYNQNDLMFAVGQGKHEQGSAYSAVSMVFKHALSWINFKLSSAAPTEYQIQVNSITLNGATYNGTLTLVNPTFDDTAVPTITDVTATWSDKDPIASVYVPNAAGTDKAAPIILTSDSQLFGNGLLVVPNHYATSFTINYTLTQGDGTANIYDYTYNLPAGTWEMAKKYFYNINITLSEIQVTPSITEWVETSTSTDVELNGEADTPASI